MQPEFFDLPVLRFVGLRVRGQEDELPDLLDMARSELARRLSEIGGVADARVIYGLTRPNEPSVAPEEVVSHVGYEVASLASAPDDMVAIAVPAGPYARFRWVGSLESEGFEAFYPAIFGALKEARRVPSAERPWLEVYDERVHDWDDRGASTNQITVLIPLEAAA
ncbi:MAG: GyrI-like domain-containing protein [Fimbriimonadaceae bacterium]